MVKRDARALVLARRAKFVSAALAGTLACGKSTAPPDSGTPSPCLSVVADPRPCLTVAMPQPPPPEDAGRAAADAGVNVPMPCLTVKVPPGSRPVGDAAPECRVPYTIDEQGQKRFKPECL